LIDIDALPPLAGLSHSAKLRRIEHQCHIFRRGLRARPAGRRVCSPYPMSSWELIVGADHRDDNPQARAMN
jgi:hypothetical protein